MMNIIFCNSDRNALKSDQPDRRFFVVDDSVKPTKAALDKFEKDNAALMVWVKAAVSK